MTIYGLQNNSFNGELVEVQCTIHQGFPSFDITGLGDNIIKESKDRIRSSIRASGLRFPQETILINLLPPTSKKTGTSLDLPIALSVLFSKSDVNAKILAMGELDLMGNIIATPGCENVVERAINEHLHIAVLPGNSICDSVDTEKLWTEHHLKVLQCDTLDKAFEGVLDAINLIEDTPSPTIDTDINNVDDTLSLNNTSIKTSPFDGIIGLKCEKEALAISAAGGHSLLFFGARGVGKSMLLSRYKSLIAPLDYKTQTELSKIRSNFNLFPSERGECLFLDNNNKTSVFTSQDKPQEILLSHGGSIIIDEITKMDERTLITLQNIHDTGVFSTNKGESYPLRFNMLGSFNPCPCGALGSRRSVCYCTENRIQAHLKNISTPLLSRFDIVLAVNEANFLHDDDSGFDDIIDRIENASKRQYKRYKDEPYIRKNGDLAIFNRSSEYIRKAYMYFPDSENPRDALLHYGVALTLADLDDTDEMKPIYVEKSNLLKINSPREYYHR